MVQLGGELGPFHHLLGHSVGFFFLKLVLLPQLLYLGAQQLLSLCEALLSICDLGSGSISDLLRSSIALVMASLSAEAENSG